MNFRCSIPIFFSALCVLISVIFSVLCIDLLIEERKEVDLSFVSSSELKIYDKSKYALMKSNYNLTDEKDVQLFLKKLQNYRYQYYKLNLEKLFCVPLNAIEIFRNPSEVLLEQIGDHLADHLNRTFHRSLLEDHKNSSEIKQNLKIFELTVLRSLWSRNYYILRNKLCLVLEYFWFTEFFLERLFRPVASAEVLIKDSHHVVRLKNDVAFDLRLIFNNNNPNLNCSSNSTEFKCMNGCLKEKHRLSKYFYNGNETGPIQLPGGRLDYKLIGKHEENCFRRCDKKLCVVTDFQKKKFDGKFSNNSNNLIKVSFFQFSPLISQYSFYLQLIGLILSFFGISSYKIALKVIVSPLPQSKKRIGSLLKLFLCSASLVAFVILSRESITNYGIKAGYRAAKTSIAYSRHAEQLGLVVCVPVGAFLKNNTEKMTLAELELATNDTFNQTVDELYLEFINKRFEVSWKLNERKVLFNANDYSSELGRCFQVEIDTDKAETQGHRIWSELKLVITFLHPNYELYFLPEGHEFNYNSFRYDSRKTPKFNKVILKSSSAKCVDYKAEYSSCDSRWKCLDACVVNKSIEYSLDVPILHVIDKDLFDAVVWSEVLPNYNLKGNPRLEDQCREEISSPDCYKTFFERDPNSGRDSVSDWSKVKTDLYYTILLKTATDESSGLDILLDLVNIQTILWDFKVLKLLTALVFFLKVKVFELHFGSRKLFLFLIYLFCLTGFVFHVQFIFNQVQNSRLVFSNYYEELAFQPMPELNFCFRHDGWSQANNAINSTGELPENQTAYSSHKLTGNHLERATHEIRADTVFSSIRYLSNERGWIELNFSGLHANETRFQMKGVTFERFYFSDKKCLSIRTNQTYHRSRFYFEDTFDDSYQVMRINFNRSFVEMKDRLVIFYTRSSDKRYLSDIKFLNYSSLGLRFRRWKTSYTVLPEHFGETAILVSVKPNYYSNRFLFLKETINNDKFRLAKNPLLYGAERFSNAEKYMSSLVDDFKNKYNATTLELPLTDENFALPINDPLFEKYDRLYRRVERPKDPNHPDGGLVYERKKIENRIKKHFYTSDNADFKFHVKFGKFKQVFRSQENLAKIILSVLNALTLWLNIQVFQTFVLKSGFFAGKAKVASCSTIDKCCFTKKSKVRPKAIPRARPKSESDIALIETSLQTKRNSC